MSLIHYQNNPMVQCNYCGKLMRGATDAEVNRHNTNNEPAFGHCCQECLDEVDENQRRASEEE